MPQTKRLTDFKTVSLNPYYYLYTVQQNKLWQHYSCDKKLYANEKIFLSKNIFIMHLQNQFGFLQVIISYALI